MFPIIRSRGPGSFPSTFACCVVHRHPSNYLARCVKQRPRNGPKAVGLGSTCPHVWLEAITVLPLAVYVLMLTRCLGVGVSASAPVRKETSVAPLLSAYTHMLRFLLG